MYYQEMVNNSFSRISVGRFNELKTLLNGQPLIITYNGLVESPPIIIKCADIQMDKTNKSKVYIDDSKTLDNFIGFNLNDINEVWRSNEHYKEDTEVYEDYWLEMNGGLEIHIEAQV